MDGLPLPQRRLAVAAISVAVGMATLDTAIANVALPTIARHLGAGGAAAVWVVNAYQIAMLATLLPFATLGDVVGHRRLYVIGLALFTVTSLACGLAWSLPSLVVARALQGIGASALMSVNTALIRFAYPSARLGRGLGFNALVVGVGFTLGPSICSAILAVASWHWLFLVNVPAGLLAIWLGLRSLPDSPPASHRFDGPAALLCGLAFALAALGLGEAAHRASALLVGAEWAAAALLAGLLLRRQRGHQAPMLATDLFARPVFALSAGTAFCAFTTQGLGFVALPFLLEGPLGRSPLETGLLITPWPAVVALLAPVAGALSDRFPAGLLCGAGLAVLSAGMAVLGLLHAGSGPAAIVLGMVVAGCGFGFYQSPNLRAIMASAPSRRSGGASGVVGTARLSGQMTGAALVALCLLLSRREGPLLALWIGCAIAAAGAVVSVLRLVPRGGTPP